MQYILNAVQAKKVDNNSIDRIGIPSMVLMERAAVAVADCVEKHIGKEYKKADIARKKTSIIAVCGCGNNGADAAAATRILFERGYNARILTVRQEGTEEYMQQLAIAKASGVTIRNKAKLSEYNIIIDGLFGIGLSRPVEGTYAKLIERINASGAWVVSVDIPSGINATNACVMQTAVRAAQTVTFGCNKIGTVLYPGAGYTGKCRIADIGFPKKAFDNVRNKAFSYGMEDLSRIPPRIQHSNKGTYGKVLVVAGSAAMGGAACLCGLSAYRSGAGLVRIFTHENNRNAVLKSVPEALVDVYGDDIQDEVLTGMLDKALRWASCVIIGPGLSTDASAGYITKYILKNSAVTTIVDADALNLIASDDECRHSFEQGIKHNQDGMAMRIVTPHLAEMARLTGKKLAAIQSDLIKTASAFASEYNVICVLKDSRTVVASGTKEVYINRSGNSGMATGGSGDVLTGVIAGMVAGRLDAFEGACMGVYLHGLGGDMAADVHGEHGMKAGDIIDGVAKVLRNGEQNG